MERTPTSALDPRFSRSFSAYLAQHAILKNMPHAVKRLGVRRALASLGYGALLGIAVGLPVSLLFPGTLKIVRLAMSLTFGIFFGPLLTFWAASRLTASGFSKNDFPAVGWPRIIVFSLLGCTVGIAAGYFAATTLLRFVNIGRVILFLLAQIGGIAGALLPACILLRNAAKQRDAPERLEP